MRRATILATVLVLALFAAGCRGEPVYDFGAVSTAPPTAPNAAERALDVGRFVSRLYADVLGRRPGTLQVAVDCDAFEAFLPGFREQNCGGLSSIAFGLDERAVLEEALGAVADPATLWPHLVGVFLSGAGVEIPLRDAIRGRESEFLRDVFRRYLDREPSPYEGWEIVRALREDPALTPRALVLGILSSEEYRGR